MEKEQEKEMLSTDEVKLAWLARLSNDVYKVYIIKTLHTDEAKLAGLARLSSDAYKANIIRTLHTDEAKLAGLEKLSNDVYKTNIIKTLSTDEDKLACLEKLSNEDSKVSIIKTLSTDEAKLTGLEKLSNDLSKANIIRTLRTDEAKLAWLEKLSNEYYKLSIIITLNADEAKLAWLDRLSSEVSKVSIIKTLHTDEAKLVGLEKLLNAKKNKIVSTDTFKTIDLPKEMTIGIEIESEGKFSNLLQGEFFGWNSKDDGSLTNGIEIVSPILRADEKSTTDIYRICSLLNYVGNSTSERCGGHIHIGANYLQDKQACSNLLLIYGNCEEILYIICNDPKDINSRTTKYAEPLSKKISDSLESDTINLESEQDLDDFIDDLQIVQGERYSGLNFQSYNSYETLEFRLPNGTINPNAWIENINLFGGIVKCAHDIREIQRKAPEIRNENENQMLEQFKKLQSDKIENGEKLEALLTLIIKEDSRAIYKNRFTKNQELLSDWQKDIYKNETTSKTIKTKDLGKECFIGKQKVKIKEIEDVERNLAISEIDRDTNNIEIGD